MQRCATVVVSLAQMASLLHDFGKSVAAFQDRLRGRGTSNAGPYRHEWVSLKLFEAFVNKGPDDDWLARLAMLEDDDASWLDGLYRDGLDGENSRPFNSLPPLAGLVAWLIMTHHRLPMPSADNAGTVPAVNTQLLRGLPNNLHAGWNQPAQPGAVTSDDWRIDARLPVASPKWRQQIRQVASELRKDQGLLVDAMAEWHRRPLIGHLARLALILGDHYYSGCCPDDPDWVTAEADPTVWANTDRPTGHLKQPLEAHLRGVAQCAGDIAVCLGGFPQSLPHLGDVLALHRHTADDSPYRWQNTAYDRTAESAGQEAAQGFFGINMASTGQGKTLANGRIMAALPALGEGPRFSIALGLRTLTLQTGDALRNRLQVGADQVAVRVGGTAVQVLHALRHEQEHPEGSLVSEQQEAQVKEGGTLYAGPSVSSPLMKYLPDEHERSLVTAPVLVCTVDHLMPATETLRGGRQIPPMLRLLTSDLVIDEVDEFDIEDLPALTRLVNWVGMLGRRVLVSSATLPPSLAIGLFEAYRAGRTEYERHVMGRSEAEPILCGWYAESDVQIVPCDARISFEKHHADYVSKRVTALEKLRVTAPRCKARLVPLGTASSAGLASHLADQLREEALNLHNQHHHRDAKTGSRVSFGVIRLANIQPLVEVARALYRAGAPDGVTIHLCCYHSRFPMLMRSSLEQSLETILARHANNGGSLAPLAHPSVRECLDEADAHGKEHLFIVMCSPVIETGRDLDFDWGIAEPSSLRSIIQLAGRLRRHRIGETVSSPNLALLRHPLRAVLHPDQPAYCWPGYETRDHRLDTHDLSSLLPPCHWEVIDAIARIQTANVSSPNQRLADLEHHRTAQMMLPPVGDKLSGSGGSRRRRASSLPALGAYSWYTEPQAQLTGALQLAQPFRGGSADEVDLFLAEVDDMAAGHLTLFRVHHDAGRDVISNQQSQWRHEELPTPECPGVRPWLSLPYWKSTCSLSHRLGLSPQATARRYGRVQMRELKVGEVWNFHEALGFYISKR